MAPSLSVVNDKSIIHIRVVVIDVMECVLKVKRNMTILTVKKRICARINKSIGMCYVYICVYLVMVDLKEK